MKSAIVVLIASLLAQVQIPKNDPTGIWESSSGTQYQLTLIAEADLKVRLVPNSSPRYTAYEVDLKVHPEEHNTYTGKGFFVAKMQSGKECRFDTEWQVTVIQKDRILGGTTNIIPDPETCAAKETSQVQLDMTRNK